MLGPADVQRIPVAYSCFLSLFLSRQNLIYGDDQMGRICEAAELNDFYVILLSVCVIVFATVYIDSDVCTYKRAYE